MTTIYKYPIIAKHETEFGSSVYAHLVPQSRKFIKAGLDSNGYPCVWALIDPETPLIMTKFILVGTGQPMDDSFFGRTHIGTFIQSPFVWHIFT